MCLKDCVLLERRLEAAYFPLKGPGRGGREFKGDTKGTRAWGSLLPGSGFRIRIQESGVRLRIQVQDSGSGFRK